MRAQISLLELHLFILHSTQHALMTLFVSKGDTFMERGYNLVGPQGRNRCGMLNYYAFES